MTNTGQLANFRMGRHTKRDTQMILTVPGVSTREKAKALVGKKVVWKTPSGKEIRGEITNLHGNSGALRVQFLKGMPGQAIGHQVEVL